LKCVGEYANRRCGKRQFAATRRFHRMAVAAGMVAGKNKALGVKNDA
jgi:hypothetical protein